MTENAARCSYCLNRKPPEAFAQQGDHVVPASLGGRWVDPNVCDECNEIANRVTDQMIAGDALVRFLRGAYRISDRYGSPPPCRFSVPVPEGGVVQVTLDVGGPSYVAAMPPDVVSRLDLGDPPRPEALAALAAKGLGVEGRQISEPLALARAAQEFASKPTPPTVWSRFMAKLGLATGRETYGDRWLDSPQASILSRDLLEASPPRFGQRTHYPPVEPVWPFEPPKHRMWIETVESVAILHVVLFGQVLGAVPVGNAVPPPGSYSAWSLDPNERSFYRSSFPGIVLGTAAAKLTRAGHDVVAVADPEHPFLYVADGPTGPAELPIETLRADSPAEGFRRLVELRRQDSRS